jgi:acetyl esterase/lipase
MWAVPKGAATDRVLLCIHGGGFLAGETLADDARLLDDHARKCGVETRLGIYPGMLHTFQMAAGRAPEADDAIGGLAGWVRPRLGLPAQGGPR